MNKFFITTVISLTLISCVVKYIMSLRQKQVINILNAYQFYELKPCQDVAVYHKNNIDMLYDGYIYSIKQIDKLGDQQIIVSLGDFNCEVNENKDFLNLIFDIRDRKYYIQGTKEEVSIVNLIKD